MNSNEYALLLACENGDFQKVRRLVEIKKTEANFVCEEYDEEGDENLPTPLHVAVYNEHFPIGSYLISLGVNLNVTNNAGNTPLHFAADVKELEIYQLLLKSGADPSIRNNKGKTPSQILQSF